MTEQLILNPATKRYVKMGSANHRRLIREGKLPAIEILPAPPKVKAELTIESKTDTEIINHTVNVIEKNQDKLKGLSQEDMDIMISKLLYERLVLLPSKRLVGRPLTVRAQPLQTQKTKTISRTKPTIIQKPLSMRARRPTKKESLDEDEISSSQIETTDNDSEENL